MNKYFKEALDQGHLEPVVLPSGKFLELADSNGRNVKYYLAGKDHINLYGQRFAAILDLTRMHETLKLTPDYLRTYSQGLDDLLTTALLTVQTDPKRAIAAISDVRTIHTRFMERSNLGNELELLYDIAAASLFTEDEDPRSLDQEHHTLKKRTLLRYPEYYAFFLQQPLSRFIPWPTVFAEDTRNLASERNLHELLEWSYLWRRYAGNGFAPATASIIESRRAILDGLIGLAHSNSNPTASS